MFNSVMGKQKNMACAIIYTLLATLQIFRTGLTKPGYANMMVVFAGWILDPGAVTFALVATSVSWQTHHEKFHRFFSRGTWNPDSLGRLVFLRIMRWMAQGTKIRIAVDDTLAEKNGEKVFGIDSHLNAVRSTKSRKVFSFGHCWVVLSIIIPLPFSNRRWALPILFRLYRNKKTCKKKKMTYRKKTELAREMVNLIVRWALGEPIELSGDSAYSCSTVVKGLPKNVEVVGNMRPDAVVTALPKADETQKNTTNGKSGSKRKKKPGPKPQRGDPILKPEDLAKDESHPWKTCKVNLNGKEQNVTYKNYYGQWYRACGFALLHIVVVLMPTGKIPYRVFFSTNTTLTAAEVLSGYSYRWAIEIFFREVKQHLGFADSAARKKEAVLRVAPFVGLMYSLLVIWFTENALYKNEISKPPVRPWYHHKKTFSFEDILRAARRALAPEAILDLPAIINNLDNSENPHQAGPILYKIAS